ncbi:MAG: hypothetical protein JWQ98_3362 [Chlorobi bacterium]|nr:hypothetical protein [Chlorobiota bacterium]
MVNQIFAIVVTIAVLAATTASAKIEVFTTQSTNGDGDCIDYVHMHNTETGGWRHMWRPCGSSGGWHDETGWVKVDPGPYPYMDPGYDNQGNMLIPIMPGAGGVLSATPTTDGCRPCTPNYSLILVMPASIIY